MDIYWEQIYTLIVVFLGFTLCKIFYETVKRSFTVPVIFVPFRLFVRFLCSTYLHYTIELILRFCLFRVIQFLILWVLFNTRIQPLLYSYNQVINTVYMGSLQLLFPSTHVPYTFERQYKNVEKTFRLR